ncbi:MAG TPA: gluconokinase [Balneolaceae bacterium]|nr:gluconokinase [Balneolaceae bacterium]
MTGNLFVLMGISGCGKTTVGKLLSETTGLPFYDGDDFHPAENKEKMRIGEPLTDKDRLPWLRTLAEHMREWRAGGGAILACSALKKEYRDLLRSAGTPDQPVQFIYLKGSVTQIANRIDGRQHEFMPPELLESQYHTLEEPEADEALQIDISLSPKVIVRKIIDHFAL